MIRTTSSPLMVLLATSACAGSPSADLQNLASAIQPPTLIDCADFTTPDTDLSRVFVEVVVPVQVDASGAVAQIGAARASRQAADRQLLDRAVSLARSCSFEPATSNGNPVPARTEVRFRLGVGSPAI